MNRILRGVLIGLLFVVGLYGLFMALMLAPYASFDHGPCHDTEKCAPTMSPLWPILAGIGGLAMTGYGVWLVRPRTEEPS